MKNMRSVIYTVAALMLSVISCQKVSMHDGEPVGPTEQVTISLATPEPVTKLIADGEKAKDVYFTAFVDGRVVPSLCQKTQLGDDGQVVLDLKLVRNVKYRFVFWAQTPVADGAKPYYNLTTFYSDSKVKVDYAVKANDDQRDAFSAAEDVYVDGPKDVTIRLRRPFSQINFGSSDYDLLKQMNLHVGMLSEMTVYGLPDTITLLDGSVSSSSTAGIPFDALFAAAPIPTGKDEYMTVQGTTYGYLGMNYVVA